jgi:thiamine-monophosphate kinase
MRTLADLGEFGLIDRIERLTRSGPRAQVVLGIGDDAAVLRPRVGEDLVVSSDSLVEDVHFRWSTQAATSVGQRALLVNLSDLAAMGARPLGFTLALAAPAELELSRLDGVIRGLQKAAVRHACPLVGGNLTRASETSLAITVLGAVKSGRALRRGPVRVRDRLFVTGTLGGAALALTRAERFGGRLRMLPVPRLAAGAALARRGRRCACIDVSDGLLADLGHLLEGSGLGAELHPERIPRPPGLELSCRRLGLDARELVLRGGEDYELLFALPAADLRSEAALRRSLGVKVSEIGRVTSGRGIRGVGAADSGGWRHF